MLNYVLEGHVEGKVNRLVNLLIIEIEGKEY
jgi:hypothetical protein